MGRRTNPLTLVPAPLAIRLSVSLSDGTFETSVSVPVSGGTAEYDAALARWLRLAGEALALGVENLNATLAPVSEASGGET